MPRWRKMMFPGTTYSESDFFAPRRLPGPGAALLATPCEAWEAGRICCCWWEGNGRRDWGAGEDRCGRKKRNDGFGLRRREVRSRGIRGWSIEAVGL